MKAEVNNHNGMRGATLLEALIALAITGIVTMAIMKLYLTQHENYLVQDNITTIQQNARASIDELTRHIRMAGHGMPASLESVVAANSNPDTITVRYVASGCATRLSEAMPQPSSELKCAGDVSCFFDGQWVYMFDPDFGGGEWFQLTEVQTGSLHLQHNTMVLSRAYGANSVVLDMNEVKFFVDQTTDPDHPDLMIQHGNQSPQVYAENIADLQFTYRLSNGVVVMTPLLSKHIREVIISVTARSDQPNQDNAQDPYRTRTYTSSVNLRNVGV
ncbi:MAG TPA: prepilin-type N-terminal cleavage/methylation domain-containing protein [Acidobacteriota bacterium]|nr:prepilin-type N-terminal cleavage/methylation domain-containing protein [Acidobacteriota bacterium]